MALNQRQFDVLTCLEKERCAKTQRELAKHTGVSLGTINKTVTAIKNHRIPEKLLNAAP